MIKTTDMLYQISQMDSPLLSVSGNRCILVRHRNGECLRCAAVCTSGAISRGDKGIAVDPEKCIGCGTCATVCPSGCLEPLNPPDDALFSEMAVAAKAGAVAFACRNAEDADAIAVECLGRVDETLIVEAVARGAQTITLLCGDCAHCVHKSGGAVATQVVASANDLLKAFGSEAKVEKRTVENHPPVVIPPSPLVILSEAKDLPTRDEEDPSTAALRASAQDDNGKEKSDNLEKGNPSPLAFQHVQEDGTLPHFVPERRLRLFNSLKALGAPQQETLRTRLWGQVSLNPAICRSCRMCAVFCPTAAIEPHDTADGGFGISHRSALCMQCRLCERICPEDAITVSDEVSLSEFTSGKKFRFEMEPIGWSPSAPNSISTRMARFLKTDAVQDPQATNKPQAMAEARAYAQKKEAARKAAREAKGHS